MRTVLVLVAAVSLSILTAGCSGYDNSGTTVASPQLMEQSQYNEADIRLAQRMRQLNAAAVDIATTALEISDNDRLLFLAQRVRSAQQSDSDRMTGWLKTWDQSTEADDKDSIEGMPSDEEIDLLGEARGAAFDRMWLDLMIRHHRVIIGLVGVHQAEGRYPDTIVFGKENMATLMADIKALQGIAV